MNSKRAQFYIVCSVVLICATSAIAQNAAGTPVSTEKQSSEVGMLTRSQWLKKIGDAAKDVNTAKEVMKKVAVGQKVEFTQRLLKAITRMPLSPEEKLTSLTQAAIACIGGTPMSNDGRYKVIAEVIAVVPVEYLPSLMGALAKRFNQKLNNLTSDQFKVMAETTIKLSVERNKSTDDRAVRNTFAMLLFLTATTPAETPGLQDLLMKLLPDDSNRELAKNWIDEAQKGNFEPMFMVAEVVDRVSVTPPRPGVQRVGVSQMEGLLSDSGGLTGSFGDAIRRNNMAPGIGIFIPGDIGIQTAPRPRPYQNQGDIL
ncbi:MAG: hypothetical protein WCJ02_00370 [bacterium]